MEASIGRVGQRTVGGRTIHRAAIVALACTGHVDPCSYQLILERFPLRDGDVWKSGERDQRNCAKAKYATPVHEDPPHMPTSINYATVHARCPQWVSLDKARIEHNVSASGASRPNRRWPGLVEHDCRAMIQALTEGPNHALRTLRRRMDCHQTDAAQQAARRAASERPARPQWHLLGLAVRSTMA